MANHHSVRLIQVLHCDFHILQLQLIHLPGPCGRRWCAHDRLGLCDRHYQAAYCQGLALTTLRWRALRLFTLRLIADWQTHCFDPHSLNMQPLTKQRFHIQGQIQQLELYLSTNLDPPDLQIASKGID